MKSIYLYFLFLILLVSCTTPGISTIQPAPVSTQAEIPISTVLPAISRDEVTINVFFPTPDTEFEMGQGINFITGLTNEQGTPLTDAAVEVKVFDPTGQPVATLPAAPGSGDVYRTDRWELPHRHEDGFWAYEIRAAAGGQEINTRGEFTVHNSTSEELLEKFGFWLDAPTLKDIVPSLMAERGDADNGMIQWGGTRFAIHVMPANWIEVHWRSGEFPLDTEEDVYSFLVEEVGDLGFTPVRAIGPFQKTTFNDWDAWEVGARGQYIQDQVEYIVFYAPEVDKTYTIGTTVVVPPAGINPHAALRSSFEVAPAVKPTGQAPEPFKNLLPKVELIRPEMGEIFVGQAQPVVLSWEPVKDLAEDEYYEVQVDYNYLEANPKVRYAVRDTSFTLPVELQEQPNCQVFNWQVRLMRQTGVDDKGQPVGEPLSYRSFYHYLLWRYPEDAPPPFDIICRNAQY